MLTQWSNWARYDFGDLSLNNDNVHLWPITFFPQTYETTLLHPDTDKSLRWRFVVILRVRCARIAIIVETLTNKLDSTVERYLEVSQLPFVMASILLDSEPDIVFSGALTLFWKTKIRHFREKLWQC